VIVVALTVPPEPWVPEMVTVWPGLSWGRLPLEEIFTLVLPEVVTV